MDTDIIVVEMAMFSNRVEQNQTVVGQDTSALDSPLQPPQGHVCRAGHGVKDLPQAAWQLAFAGEDAHAALL